MIENNRFLFLATAGLTASGADGHDHADTEISALAEHIWQAGFAPDLLAWFAHARTGQVEVNPYYPRGSWLACACFFVDDAGAFDVDAFYAFAETLGGLHDPVGDNEFRGWFATLPERLAELGSHPATGPLWAEYCHIVEARSAAWQGMLKQAAQAADAFFGPGGIQMSFAPNLFTPYSADFVRVGCRVITIASSPDAETMLHETLHTAVATHRPAIRTYAEAYGLKGFADAVKMREFGYLAGETPSAYAHVIEECIVRALAATLAKKDFARLRFHADYGCTAVPYIAEMAREMKPTVATLGPFVDAVMEKAVTMAA